MSLPYRYTPRPGEEIHIVAEGEDARLYVAGKASGGVLHASARILAGEVPRVAAQIAAAMHEAAGLPAPVILERPAQIPGRGEGNEFGRFTLVYNSGHEVGIAVNGHGDGLPPAEARRMAAHLLARADEAQSQPDPAEVGELAAVIAADRDRAGHPHELDLHTAEVILRAGWKRGAP